MQAYNLEGRKMIFQIDHTLHNITYVPGVADLLLDPEETLNGYMLI